MNEEVANWLKKNIGSLSWTAYYENRPPFNVRRSVDLYVRYTEGKLSHEEILELENYAKELMKNSQLVK